MVDTFTYPGLCNICCVLVSCTYKNLCKKLFQGWKKKAWERSSIPSFSEKNKQKKHHCSPEVCQRTVWHTTLGKWNEMWTDLTKAGIWCKKDTAYQCENLTAMMKWREHHELEVLCYPWIWTAHHHQGKNGFPSQLKLSRSWLILKFFCVSPSYYTANLGRGSITAKKTCIKRGVNRG